MSLKLGINNIKGSQIGGEKVDHLYIEGNPIYYGLPYDKNGAIAFDGLNDRIVYDENTALKIRKTGESEDRPLVIFFRMKPLTPIVYKRVLAKAQSALDALIGLDGEYKLSAYFYEGNGNARMGKKSGGAAPVNTWIDFCVIKPNANPAAIKLYSGGSQDISAVQNNGAEGYDKSLNSSPWSIGYSEVGGSPQYSRFDLFELSIWFDTTFTIAEYQEAYNGGIPHDLRLHSKGAPGMYIKQQFGQIEELAGNSITIYGDPEIIADQPT